MTNNFDIAVIGAGIAGASAAAELAESAKVILLDMESHPGFHATGRSAAYFAVSYGNHVVRGITEASEHFYRTPPSGFTDTLLIRPRAAMFIARDDQLPQLNEMQQEIPSLQQISAAIACARVPILERAYVSSALYDDRGGDLDVDAILQAYLRLFRRRGGSLLCQQQVKGLNFSHGRWRLQIENQSITAPIIVNAAGAWAGEIAAMAGLTPLGLQPKKRTVSLLDIAKIIPASKLNGIGDWPLVVDIDEEFYFKPDAGHLLVSPADETPCNPCDAKADELDIAIAMDRIQKATTLKVQRVNHSWAGLRTFAPDENFIAGFDPRAAGFFWLAGQGGYGVQSAPGLAHLVNNLITHATLSNNFSPVLQYRDDIAPERLIRGQAGGSTHEVA